MQWRTSFISFVVAPMVAAAACSDAALLEPKGDDPEGSGAVAGNGAAGSAVASGGRRSTGGTTATGGRIIGSGGAGGGPAPWPIYGGSPGTGGYWGTGGYGTGGTVPCQIEEPLSVMCARYPGICTALPQMGPVCSQATQSGNLVYAIRGCNYVRLEIGDGLGTFFGVTYDQKTGQPVEVFTSSRVDGCSYHAGIVPSCNDWFSTTCDALFGDGGIVTPPPPPRDAGLD